MYHATCVKAVKRVGAESSQPRLTDFLLVPRPNCWCPEPNVAEHKATLTYTEPGPPHSECRPQAPHHHTPPSPTTAQPTLILACTRQVLPEGTGFSTMLLGFTVAAPMLGFGMISSLANVSCDAAPARWKHKCAR